MDSKNTNKNSQQPNPSISPHLNHVSLNRKADGDNAKQGGEELKKPRINVPSNQYNNTTNTTHQNRPNVEFSYNNQVANANQMSSTNSNHNSQLNAGLNQAQQYHQFPPPGFWAPQHGPPMQAQQPSNQLDHNVGPYKSQVPAGNGNSPANVPRNVGPVPNAYYPFGYPSGPPSPYTGGPWDPSMWWGQMQQFPPFSACPFPGATNYFPPSAQHPTPNCSAPEKSSPKGATLQSSNMSSKDQSLCDAQVPENVRLWTAIAALHANFAWALKRIVELDTEIKSLKSEREQRTSHDIVSPSTEQTRKRGRPKKVVDSSDSSPSPIPPLPIPQVNTKAALSKAPLIKEINFQKNYKDKAEFMGTVSPLIPPNHLSNGPNFTNIPRSPRSSLGTNSSQAKFAITNQQLIEQVTREGMHGGVTPQGFYNQVNVSQKGTGEVETRMNESNGDSEELDEGTTDSEKDENEDTARGT